MSWTVRFARPIRFFAWPDLLTCRRHVGHWRFDFRCQDGGSEQNLSQKFDHCARQYEEHGNGEITVSMKRYVQRQRFPKKDGNCWMTCSLRVINGPLRGITKVLLNPSQFVVQRKQGQGRVSNLMRANEVIDEIKQRQEFHFDLTCSRLEQLWSHRRVRCKFGRSPQVRIPNDR